MPLAFESGYVEVMAMADELAHLGRSTWFQDYIDHKQLRRRHLVPLDELVVDEIRLKNNSSYSDDVLLERLELEAGKNISSEELDESVRNLYALDRFERVDYRIEQIDDENVILLDVREKSWGPNFIDFRFALEDDFENSTDYSFGIAFNVTGLSRAGAEWRTELEYGSDKRIATGLYLPFVKDNDWFSLISAEYKNTDYNIPLHSAKSRLWKILIPSFLPLTPILFLMLRLAGSQHFGRSSGSGCATSAVKLKYWVSRSSGLINAGAKLAIYVTASIPSMILCCQSKVICWSLNSRHRTDNSPFGWVADIDDFSVHFDASWKGAVTYGDHTFMGKAEYGRVRSDFDLRLDPKELGGFLNLSGIPKNSLSGNNKIFTAAIYRYNLMEQDFGLFKSSVFFGGSVEYGGVYNDPELDFKDVPLYTAGSLYSGITTPVGPLIFAYGRTEQSNHAFYVFFGGAL